MKLQQNMSMVVFTDQDYQSIKDQITRKYQNKIDNCNVGISEVEFKDVYEHGVCNIDLRGVIEVVNSYDPYDVLREEENSYSSIYVLAYKIYDEDGLAVESDFEPVKLK